MGFLFSRKFQDWQLTENKQDMLHHPQDPRTSPGAEIQSSLVAGEVVGFGPVLVLSQTLPTCGSGASEGEGCSLYLLEGFWMFW